jgi:hypothetical protein
MTRFARVAAALAVVAIVQPASAYVHETTTPGHPDTGFWLWWGSRSVTYQINAGSAAYTPCGSVAAAEAAAEAGLAAWGAATSDGTSACTDFTFVGGEPTTQIALGKDNTNLVVFREKRCSDIVGTDPCTQTPGACASKFNCWEYGISTIGFTTTTFDVNTGEILDADVELFGWDGKFPKLGHHFTCANPGDPPCSSPGDTGCNEVDVTSVVTHEAGHMLGLDHVCSSAFPAPFNACPAPRPIMAPQVGQVTQRGLAADDVDGVCEIYPKGGPTLTGGVGGTGTPSSGGCSSAGGGGLAALLAGAALGVARLRRRRR